VTSDKQGRENGRQFCWPLTTFHWPLSYYNRYAYALNNPETLIDPLGLFQQAPGTQPDCDNMADPVCANEWDVYLTSPCSGFDLLACTGSSGGATGGAAGSGGGGPAPAPTPPSFPLGLRLANQTFSQCMAQNSNTYSIGGGFQLGINSLFGSNLTVASNPVANFFAGNAISSLLFGSGSNAASTLASYTPSGLGYFMGAPLTYGRRTSDVMSLNLGGVTGGSPQALSQASSGVQDFLGEIGDVFSLGMSFTTRLGVDAALAGAEAIGCSIPQ
jgi:hypothetical protein